MRRERISPWGCRRMRAILVDTCRRCGCHEAREPLSYREARWLERVNRREAVWWVRQSLEQESDRAD